MRPRVNMPKWPAWLMAIVGVGCAYPAISNEPSGAARTEQELYEAHGTAPHWSLTMHYGRIDYEGADGSRLTVLRPAPQVAAGGRDYATPQLSVDLADGRCNDPANGKAYADRVTVIAGGHTFNGCGGARRPQWDMKRA